MNLFIQFFVCYFFVSVYVNVLATNINKKDSIVNEEKEENIKNALQDLTEEELKEFAKFYKAHEHDNDNVSKQNGASINQNSDATAPNISVSSGSGDNDDINVPNQNKKGNLTKSTSGQNGAGGVDNLGDMKNSTHKQNTGMQNASGYTQEIIKEKKEEQINKGKGNVNNKMSNVNDEELHTDGTGTKKGDNSMNEKDFFKNLNLQDDSINKKEKQDSTSDVLEQINNMFQQMHNKNADTKINTGAHNSGGIGTGNRSNEKDNKQWLDNFENLFNQFLNINEQKRKAFQLDKSINHDNYPTKSSILLEHSGNVKPYKNENENDHRYESLYKNLDTENNGTLDKNNEKLKNYFNSLSNDYNPYSYERKILDDLANDDDIKNKYNITDEFEQKILEHFERGTMHIDDDEDYYTQMEAQKKEREKRKKEEMFEDINEQDDNDSIEQGSINNRLLRKSQIGKKMLFKNILNSTDNSLYECNCSHKNKNCVLYYMDLNNLEYILQSLEINVKKMVNKYTGQLLEKQELLKGKKEKHSDSLLLPLPPSSKYADVKDISSYVLRVPKVLFLTTRKSFSSSFDRYFYHLYNIMENQFKWNTYLWGYGFKYYPIMYPKNLNSLLQSQAHHLGRKPFDLVFVHESFISNYYNYYFFAKDMPQITTLIFITDGWDSTIKKKFLNLLPNIMFQNQVNIFEFNPLNTIDIEEEKKRMSNNLWNKMANTGIQSIIDNRHKKKNEEYTSRDKKIGNSTNSNQPNSNYEHDETLWAFLPHGVNHCCSSHYDEHFEAVEEADIDGNSEILLHKENDNYENLNPYGDTEDNAQKKNSNNYPSEKGKNDETEDLINKNKKYESSYTLLDLFLQKCEYKNAITFNNITKDIDVLFLYNTSTTKQNDFVVQKIMDNIYNKHMDEFKNPIKKYVVDTYFWKIWGLQTTHQLIKNKVQEYNNILQRSKVCVISSKFAGTLNKMVLDALFNGCVVVTDKSHNKNLNKYLVRAQIPFEYYEITDLIYNKQNLENLSKDLISKIKKTLNEVNTGEKNQLRIDAYKTILSTYTYTGLVLNWIIPSLYFYYNREKYELTNNYFVLPHYFENIITRSLKATSAKREKIIASIDISLQEDIIMNNNEVFVWGLIWVFIFSIIMCYILRNSSFINWFVTRRKEAYR